MGLPNEINPILLKSSSGGGGGGSSYTISRSLRTRASASAYLNRTPASSGSLTTWTFSCWLKRGSLTSSAFQNIFLSQTLGSSANYAYFGIDYSSGYGDGSLVFEDFTSGVSRGFYKTSASFRDPSAWYHIVLRFDTTQAIDANRVRFYINGISYIPTATTTIPLNQNGYMNTGSVPHFIGCNNSNPSSNFFDGYLAEVNFIDGQSLAASSFGQDNAALNKWEPKQYTGSYGTNGFYLNFSDNSAATAAAIGKDSSGNGNNWTPNNISLTSGITYDSMIDTPTPYDDGTEYGRGNYAVLNPHNGYGTSSGSAISQGNLRILGAKFGTSTIPLPTSGKWYAEATIVSASLGFGPNFGISDSTWTTYIATVRAAANTIVTSGSGITNTYGSFTNLVANDIIGLAFDATNGTFNVYRNNTLIATWSGSGLTGNPNNMMFVFHGDAVTDDAHFNFGQRPFVYTPPSGYKALNTQNLPTPAVASGETYMDATLYTGTGSALTVTNAGSMQPDFLWLKNRSLGTGGNHVVFDSVRGGPSTELYPNTTAVESPSTGALTSLNTNGFTLGNSGDLVRYNSSGNSYVAWQWKKGATPGFDIVTYSGPVSPGVQNISHNLGVAPSLIIVKARDLASRNWSVYHKSLGPTYVTWLNLTSGSSNSARTGYWNDTSPTSSVFTVGTDNDVNANGYNYVAYLWAEVAGFSKFGTYAGNGNADGPFVYCGFRPRFIITKNSTTTSDWVLKDTARSLYNNMSEALYPNLINAENTGTTDIDTFSNGFKIRNTGGGMNSSGSTYIYMAFARNPFKYALAR
jgi:hypothetical protein